MLFGQKISKKSAFSKLLVVSDEIVCYNDTIIRGFRRAAGGELPTNLAGEPETDAIKRESSLWIKNE
jgi:hypothetical protein